MLVTSFEKCLPFNFAISHFSTTKMTSMATKTSMKSEPICQTGRKGNTPDAEDNISTKQIDLVEKKKIGRKKGHLTRTRATSHGSDIIKTNRPSVIVRDALQMMQGDSVKVNQISLLTEDDINNSSMWTLAKNARYSRLPVFVPYSTHMSVIECSMVICLLYVAIVTPLQLSYLGEIQKFDNCFYQD